MCKGSYESNKEIFKEEENNSLPRDSEYRIVFPGAVEEQMVKDKFKSVEKASASWGESSYQHAECVALLFLEWTIM